MAVELFQGRVAGNITLAQAIVRRHIPMPKYVCALYTLNEDTEAIQSRIDDAASR